jgi:chemotaxis signal transduction protein
VNEDQLHETARKILLARAERLRQRPTEEEKGVFWIAEFPLGGTAYALPLDALVACQPLRLVTSVPLCDPHLTGIVRYQRRILTVMSLAGLLGSQGWRRDPSVMLVLRLGPDRLAAVDCEEIPRSASLDLSLVTQARLAEPTAKVLELDRPGSSPLHLIQMENLFAATGGRHGT